MASASPERFLGGATDMASVVLIPADIERFLRETADSFVKLEILKFFHANPHVLGTAEDISLAIGRRGKFFDKALSDLIAAGILRKDGHAGVAELWSFHPSESLAERIAAVFEYYREPGGRARIVRYLLEKSA